MKDEAHAFCVLLLGTEEGREWATEWANSVDIPHWGMCSLQSLSGESAWAQALAYSVNTWHTTSPLGLDLHTRPKHTHKHTHTHTKRDTHTKAKKDSLSRARGKVIPGTPGMADYSRDVNELGTSTEP